VPKKLLGLPDIHAILKKMRCERMPKRVYVHRFIDTCALGRDFDRMLDTQLINYLKATNKQVGLLFNFGKKPDFKRAILSNEKREISETKASNPRESASFGFFR